MTKLLRGELDWIVMKSLDKDRTRRYETANAFALDIQRYLAGEPVLAAPPSAGYRLRKYAHKYQRLLATAAAFALLLLLGAVLSTWQAVRATRAEAHAWDNEAIARNEAHKARVAADAEAVQRQRAEDNERQARASEAEARLTLTDMHTSHGLMAGERDDPAQAILWFANDSRLAGAGTEREIANRARVAAWSHEVFLPVRALEHTASWVPRLQFHPSGQYVLTQTNQGDCTLWIWLSRRRSPCPRESARPAVRSGAPTAAGWRWEHRKEMWSAAAFPLRNRRHPHFGLIWRISGGVVVRSIGQSRNLAPRTGPGRKV